ncbi:hypothetical protein ACI39X_27575, partial [Klebsiella pneumoniae]|uniref:hypothetical protein n=1 Tax=Klebsiella pneumoniae TaxID=573 RepID=UPI0038534D76
YIDTCCLTNNMDNEGLIKAEDSKYWPFNLPLQFDENVWYVESSRDCKGIKHYPVGNAHTFVGRMLVWCPKQDSLIYRSLSEMPE